MSCQTHLDSLRLLEREKNSFFLLNDVKNIGRRLIAMNNIERQRYDESTLFQVCVNGMVTQSSGIRNYEILIWVGDVEGDVFDMPFHSL